MLKNKISILMIAVLLNSFLLSVTIAAPVPSLAFHGVGLTVNLTYPEEAHPTEEIYHNVTITSQTDLTISNLTLTIYGTVNQTQQEITNLALFSWTLDQNTTLTNRINFTIPQETVGNLYCTFYAKTNQDTDYLFTSFYTTQVDTITFSELVIQYNQLLLEFNNNLLLFKSLNQTYYSLIEQNNNLQSDYTNMGIDYRDQISDLTSDLKDQIKINQELQIEYDSLNTNHTSIKENFASLDQNFTDLIETNTLLEEGIIVLEQEINDSRNSLDIDRNLMVVFIVILVSLIGLIIYLRNKQKEPYVVIRKETVSVKPKKQNHILS